jgi:calcium-binding protein CML
MNRLVQPKTITLHFDLFFVCTKQLKACLFCFLPFSDEDSNGEIDKEELKNCFQKLEIAFTEEISDLFEACDINEDMGMKFNEFIVFLCLVYLLNEPAASEAVSFILYMLTLSILLLLICYRIVYHR